jgi:tetratricopeptide (TPR) repeat protein
MSDLTAAQLISMARQLLAAGDLAGAEGLARRAIAMTANPPVSRDAWIVLAHIAQQRQDLAGAQAFWRKAAAIGAAAGVQELLAAEIERLLRNAGDRPADPVAWFEAGKALQEARDLDRALACYRRALELEPRYTAAMNNLGLALHDCGDTQPALDALSAAIDMPGGALSWDNYLYVLHFLDGVTTERIAAEHARWARSCAPPVTGTPAPFPNERDPHRRLRIGYVSPHFHRHPVGRMLIKLLASHEHASAEVICYSAGRRTDDITAALRLGADRWLNVHGITDAALADQIRADRIDVLIDLTMHMSGNRLGTFALRPAPVQITYLAYPSTTGLPQMDFRVTDPLLDPSGSRPYPEKNLALPDAYWCYAPPAEAPEINTLPALRNNHVTFASLNAFCKVSPRALAAWIRILNQVPRSELVIHAYPGPHRARVLGLFSAAGVAPDRIRFFDRLPLKDYLTLHHQIDIALDPFAYAGGTTTLDAAFMGVPTISLAGHAPHTRGGASILTALQLPELLATAQDPYIDAAVRLASDLPRLSDLRQTLRLRLTGSVLCDGPRFARAFHAACRNAWQNWCAAGSPSKPD